MRDAKGLVHVGLIIQCVDELGEGRTPVIIVIGMFKQVSYLFHPTLALTTQHFTIRYKYIQYPYAQAMAHQIVGISALVVLACVFLAHAQPYFYDDYHYSDLMDDYQVRECVAAGGLGVQCNN